jgi:hypothetical protein
MASMIANTSSCQSKIIPTLRPSCLTNFNRQSLRPPWPQGSSGFGAKDMDEWPDGPTLVKLGFEP